MLRSISCRRSPHCRYNQNANLPSGSKAALHTQQMKVWSSLGIMCTWRAQCFCKSSSIAPSSLNNLHHGLHPAVDFGLPSLGNLLAELPVTAPALEEITLNSCTLMYCQAPFGTASSSPCAKGAVLAIEDSGTPSCWSPHCFPSAFRNIRPSSTT